MTTERYNHPLNLGLRFILEVFGFYALGAYGLAAFDAPWHVVAAIAFPFTAAIIWGVFRVPNDGGEPKVKVHGRLRILIEFLFFSLAIAAFFGRDEYGIAGIYLLVVLMHYIYSHQRLRTLWKNELLEAPFLKK